MIELKDIFSERINNCVCWVSRHDLDDRQERALYYAHDKNVIIKHYNKIVFSTLLALVNTINYLTKDGIVYLVVPNDQFEEIRRGNCPDVCFRTLSGYTDDQGSYIFTSIIEHRVVNGKYSSSYILKSSQLDYYISREEVFV